MPRASHAGFEPSSTRPDPISLLEEQAASRVPELVPIRYGRMLVSPFAFYRGAALIMASDLAGTPRSGLTVQACGDAHMSNFGVFASAERSLVFDVNDFDETLPGPWEWDLKRLAGSLVVAGRDRGFTAKERTARCWLRWRATATRCRPWPVMRDLDVWYRRLDADQVLKDLGAQATKTITKRADKVWPRPAPRTAWRRSTSCASMVDGQPRIVSDPPLISRLQDLLPGDEADEFFERIHAVGARPTGGRCSPIGATCSSSSRWSTSPARWSGWAASAPGPGSCCWKAATGPTRCSCRPKRRRPRCWSVSWVRARLHQLRGAGGGRAAPDAGQQRHLLGLGTRPTASTASAGTSISANSRTGKARSTPISMVPDAAVAYARVCGWTLARAHARSGDRIAIAAYLGTSPAFDRAIAAFAESYAEQNQRDYEALQKAVGDGRVTAQTGL